MTVSSVEELPPAFRRHLTEADVQTNSTLQSFDAISGQLATLERHRGSIDTILDVGCKGGGFAAAVGAHLDATTVYGIEIVDELRERAADRGVTTYDVDVETDSFPIDDESVDLVISFGLLEHLRYYDGTFEEIARVLRDGWFWVATPNLGSWINRIALLTGHQPRNVELSTRRAVGTLPVYAPDEFLNHVHAPTYGALLELLTLYGFDPISTAKLTPYQRSRLVAVLDWLFGLRTSWSRRVAVLAEQA